MINAQLPSHMVPRYVIALDEFPFTPSGKIDRKALPEINQENTAVHIEYTPANNDIENILVKLWQEVLTIGKIGVTDNFLEAGGNSLLAVRLARKISDITNLNIAAGDIFAYPTIRQIASVIKKGYTPKFQKSIALTNNPSAPLLFCCCGINIYQTLADKLTPSFSTHGVYTPIEDSIFQINEEENSHNSLPSIEAIAKEYVDIIYRQQGDQGPYFIAGVSLGGVIAYEIAQQLQSQGKTVAHLFLIDPVLPSSIQWLPISWMQHKAKRLLQLPLDKLKRYKNKKLTPQTPRNNTDVDPATNNNQDDKSDRKRVRTLICDYEEHIQPYSGDATLFHSNLRAKRPGYQVPNDCGWGKLIKQTLHICNLNTDHLGGLF